MFVFCRWTTMCLMISFRLKGIIGISGHNIFSLWSFSLRYQCRLICQLICLICQKFHAARCTLHVSCCTFHVARCTLHVACYTLHVACYMLHVACCMLYLYISYCISHIYFTTFVYQQLHKLPL